MPAKTKAVNLRFRVRFDKLIGTDAPAGGATETWEEQFTRWAEIIQQRGGEGVQAQRLQGTQPAIIIVRSDSDTRQIDVSWRAVWVKDGEPHRIYALKTCEDMEGERGFITMQAVNGEPDS